jgi:hypothetical protein
MVKDKVSARDQLQRLLRVPGVSVVGKFAVKFFVVSSVAIGLL